MIQTAAQTALQADTQPTCTLSVIPPGPVTDKIEVEIRLGLRNRDSRQREFQVDFYWDAVSKDQQLTQRQVTLTAGEAQLVSAWAKTEGHVGEHALVYQVRDGTDVCAGGRWPLTVVESDTRALPIIRGGWFTPGVLLPGCGYPRAREVRQSDLRDALDAMKHIGMNMLLVSYVERDAAETYYPSTVEGLGKQHFDFDVIETLLSQADANGMHVFLGLGRGKDTYLLWNGLDDRERIDAAVALGKRVAAELWKLYGHHRSFYGWYLTHEMRDLPKASAYYDPLADFCHSLAPDKPVLVAPAGTPIIDAETLRRSSVDIFAYQDCVGSGYKDFKYTHDPEVRLADLPDILARHREAHAGTDKHMWADLEIWRTNPATGYAPFLPGPIDQIKRQLDIESRHVDVITAYEVFCVMESPDSTLVLGGADAVRLYKEYEQHYREFKERQR